MVKTILDDFPNDASCKNCKHRTECDFYREDRKEWICGNWMKDIDFQEQLQFDF